MIDNKHINKLAAVIMAVAVVALMAFIIFFGNSFASGYGSGGSAAATGVTMEYESTLFDASSPIEINISMDEDKWEDLLKNAISEEYYACDVTVNGETYKNAAIRAKGNTSLSMVASSDSDRYSFKISFDEYVDGQNVDGLSSLILNNNYSDATLMKEAVCYDMFSFLGADASLYNYAKISVNGQYWGVYLALEPVDEDLAIRNYGLGYGQLYKPDSQEMGGRGKMNDFEMDSEGNFEMKGEMPDMSEIPDKSEMPERSAKSEDSGGQPGDVMAGDGMAGGGRTGGGGMSGGGADLNYIDDNLSSYETIWEGSVFKSTDTDHSRVVTALKNICADDVSTETLGRYMDVDNVLKYMAVHTFVVNLDSLSGNMAHNYYLYEDGGMLNIIPWDYNLAFGGFQSQDSSETVNFPIDTPFSSGISLEDRQFFAALLENEEYLDRYHEYLRKLAEEYVDGGIFEQTVQSIRSNIDSLAETDPTAFFTYEEYDAAVSMLIDTVNLRAESVLGQLDGSIPSTREGQQESPDALVDASSIELSVMGSMGGGKGGLGGDRQSSQDSDQASQGNQLPAMPDGDTLPQMPENGQNGQNGQMPGGMSPPQGGGGRMGGGQPPDMKPDSKD